ncbi:MAG: cupin domain-containing protein [Pseudomonadota bacterium]
MSKMNEMISGLRRIVTANDVDGKSHIMIDGGPADEFRTGDLGGLLEIWQDEAGGPLDARPCEDKGAGTPILSPDKDKVKIRWFTSGPTPEGAPPEMIADLTRQAFLAIGAGDHQPDTSKHPAMHTTHTLDAIILVKGCVRLILDKDETVIGPGDVVIQRATNHAWAVEGEEPALFVAVLVDRS